MAPGADGAAHPLPGARAGCDRLIPDTVPGAPGMVPLPIVVRTLPSLSSPGLRVNPLSLMSLTLQRMFPIDQPWDPRIQGLHSAALISPCSAAAQPLWFQCPQGLGMDPDPLLGWLVVTQTRTHPCVPGSSQALLQSCCDTAWDTEMRVGANLWGHQARH